MSETRLRSAVVTPSPVTEDLPKPVISSDAPVPDLKTSATDLASDEALSKPRRTSAVVGDEVALTVPRTVGLIGAMSFIVGTIIGSGIFVSPKGVVHGSGSVALTLCSWVICGIISTLAALCYAEMGCVIKVSGADYAFLDAAFGSWLSFIFSWCWAIILKPASIATLSLTASQYLLALFFEDGCGHVPESIKKTLAIFLMITLLGINLYSVVLAERVQVFFTAAKLLALLIIIVGGVYRLCTGYTKILATGFSGTHTNPGVVAVGFYGGMFAFDGWNSANFISEEIINPQRNLPLAIILGVPMVIIVYLMTNISFFTVMSTSGIIASEAVAVTWAEHVIPVVAWLIPIFVAMSSFGSCNGSLFACGRLLFVTARNDHMPEVLAMVHVKKFGPAPASILLIILSIIFALVGTIGRLINFITFIKWIFYGLNMLSLIILRYRKKYKDVYRPFKVPLVIPVFVFVSAIFIVVVPIIENPQWEFLYAAAFIVIGYALYLPFVYFKLRLNFLKHFTMFSQLFLQVAKPAKAME